MKAKETFHFNKKDYQRTISAKSYSYTRLAKGIYKKRATTLGSNVHVVINALGIIITGGLTLIPMGIACRNVSVQSQKLALLEVEWARRGQERLPHRTIDKIIPIALAFTTSSITLGIDAGLASAVGDHLIHGVLDNVNPCDPSGYLISDTLASPDAVAVGHAFQGVLSQQVDDLDDWGDDAAKRIVGRDSRVAKHVPRKDTPSSTGDKKKSARHGRA